MNVVEKLQGVLAADAASLALGIEVQSACVEQVVLSLEVTQQMTNGYRVCHGGVIFSLADTALAFACVAIDEVALTQSAQVDYVQSAQLGDKLRAVAVIMHRRKRNIFCDVEVLNQNDQLIALVRGRQLAIATS